MSFNPSLILIENKGTTNIWNYTVFKHENVIVIKNKSDIYHKILYAAPKY